MRLLPFRASNRYAACNRCENALLGDVQECPHCGMTQKGLVVRAYDTVDGANGRRTVATRRKLVPYPSVPEEVESATAIARQRVQVLKRVALWVATGAMVAVALMLTFSPNPRARLDAPFALLHKHEVARKEESPTLNEWQAQPAGSSRTPGPAEPATTVLSVPSQTTLNLVQEQAAANDSDENVDAARLALIGNDLTAAGKSLSQVSATRMSDPEAQRISDELSRREAVRDADMQRARACERANFLPCARRYAKAALGIDKSNIRSRMFLKHIAFKQAAQKSAQALVQAAQTPRMAPIVDATALVHYITRSESDMATNSAAQQPDRTAAGSQGYESRSPQDWREPSPSKSAAQGNAVPALSLLPAQSSRK